MKINGGVFFFLSKTTYIGKNNNQTTIFYFDTKTFMRAQKTNLMIDHYTNYILTKIDVVIWQGVINLSLITEDENSSLQVLDAGDGVGGVKLQNNAVFDIFKPNNEWNPKKMTYGQISGNRLTFLRETFFAIDWPKKGLLLFVWSGEIKKWLVVIHRTTKCSN